MKVLFNTAFELLDSITAGKLSRTPVSLYYFSFANPVLECLTCDGVCISICIVPDIGDNVVNPSVTLATPPRDNEFLSTPMNFALVFGRFA